MAWGQFHEGKVTASFIERWSGLIEVEEFRAHCEHPRPVAGVKNAHRQPCQSRVLSPGLKANQENETEHGPISWNNGGNEKISGHRRPLPKPEMQQGNEIYGCQSQK